MNRTMTKQTVFSGSEPFARENVIREIFDHVCGAKQDSGSFSLVGPRFVGKSTILRFLTSQKCRNTYLNGNNAIHLVYFDCFELPANKRDVFRTFAETGYQVAKQDWGLDPDPHIGSQIANVIKNSEDELEILNSFEMVFRFLESQQKRIVLILDHFEQLLSLLSESNIQLLRDVFANTAHGLVVATPRPIRELSPKTFPSRFYEIFKKYRLGVFSRDDSYEFTQTRPAHRGRVSLSEAEEILRRVGYHPAFLAVYLDEFWKEKAKRGPDTQLNSYDAIDKRARVRLSDTFFAIWTGLDDPLKQFFFDFVAKERTQADMMRVLQRLEDEHGVVYRDGDGSFCVMGKLLQEFVESQTNFLERLLMTDYYRAGLRAMDTVREGEYKDTEPGYYYQSAYRLWSKTLPDLDAANAMIRSSLESLLDVMVKRSEQHLGKGMVGAGYKQKRDFISEAFVIEGRVSKVLDAFWELANESGPHPGPRATPHNTQLRFYLLSASAQYLLLAQPKPQGHPS